MSDVRTILLVDDEPNILSSLKRTLRKLKLDVHTAESGQSGLEILQSNEVALIISDMRMPEMDGAKFLVSSQDIQPNAIRFLLTGYAEAESVQSALNEGGISQYLTKPWDDEELRDTISAAVDNYNHERKQRQLKGKVIKEFKALKKRNAELEAEPSEQQPQTSPDLIHNLSDAIDQAYDYVTTALTRALEGYLQDDFTINTAIAHDLTTLAEKLNLSDFSTKALVTAGKLHNLGMLQIPQNIIEQPYETLSDEARTLFEQHPHHGANIIGDADALGLVKDIIATQCEYPSGTGYPKGLSGDDYPEEAKILCLVRDYHYLCTGKLTGEAMEPEQAGMYLKNHIGKAYRSEHVDVYIALIDEQLKANRTWKYVQVSDLEPGMILAEDLNAPDGTLLLSQNATITPSLISRANQLANIPIDALKAKVQK